MRGANGLHASKYRFDPVCGLNHGDSFERISMWAVRAVGCRWGFRCGLFLILAWVASRPYFRYHEAWTTTFSIATTIMSFLLVFLVQHAQNRESKAVHLKLDELIYAAKNARNELICIEHLSEEQLDRLGERYHRLAEHYQRSLMATTGDLLTVTGQQPACGNSGCRDAEPFAAPSR
jgi:low affinity Fe/Cu permease